MPGKNPQNAEQVRLAEDGERTKNWKRWGPYLSEREWGTVREDYSSDGESWRYFTHEHARSRAYRWGEDGLLGITDRECRLCFSVALWNGKDPFLKERLFGLTNLEGNHGEDVKECHFYMDSTPTHSWMSALYKYPQAAFPYERLRSESSGRTRDNPEFELSDTGIFDEGRYFDVTAEYAKANTDDLCIRITVANRGPERAALHLLPTLWFRNTWSWGCRHEGCGAKPSMAAVSETRVRCEHDTLGTMFLDAEPGAGGPAPLLFTENENNARLLFGSENESPYTKDSIGDFVTGSAGAAVNPGRTGTKCAAHYLLDLGPGEERSVRLRLRPGVAAAPFGPAFERTMKARRSEADDFHAALCGPADPEARRVARQAYAGLLWSKQFYHYVVGDWLQGDTEAAAAARRAADRPQQRLASCVRAGRDLDAGQVGISVVRRVGPRVPHDPDGAPGPRVRQGAAEPAAPGVVHAPERADPGVRVELLGRQPARARLGVLAGLQDHRSARDRATASSSRGCSRSSWSTSPGG